MENGWFLKRTMAEKNRESTPRPLGAPVALKTPQTISRMNRADLDASESRGKASQSFAS